MPTTKRARGRPRNPDVDKEILQATRDILASEGYMRMTMDAVAVAAGVTRPTIYLRWPSKEKLVIAAISDLERPQAMTKSGDTLADLKAVVRAMQVSFVDHGNAQLMGPIQSERNHAPELFEEFREKLLVPRREFIRGILEDGVASGQVKPDVDLDATVNILAGALYSKLMAGDNVPADFSDRVVAAIFHGIRKA